MDQHNATLASGLVSSTYIQQGADALCTRRKLIKTLLSQRSLPKHGWDEDTVELFIKASPFIHDCIKCVNFIAHHSFHCSHTRSFSSRSPQIAEPEPACDTT